MAGPYWNIPSSVARSVFPPNEAQLDLFQNALPAERSVRLTGGAALMLCETARFDGRPVALDYVRHPKARVYRLVVRSNGSVRITVPRYGTLAEARNFLQRHADWLAGRLLVLADRRAAEAQEVVAGRIRFRGEMVPVVASENGGELKVGLSVFRMPRLRNPDLIARAEAALRTLALVELPVRIEALATLHGISLLHVSIRNQKTRWGSCSVSGSISLNWRLVQVPEVVRDYVLLHELAHRRHMNHSALFWAEVQRLCPEYQESERWLREKTRLIL